MNTLIGNNSRVTTRMRGDIPGCVPAVDVFVSHTTEAVREHVLKQADKYCSAIRRYLAGEYGGDHGWDEMWYDATKGNTQLVFIRQDSADHLTLEQMLED